MSASPARLPRLLLSLAGGTASAGNVPAALPGSVTACCSCSAVPLAVLIGVPMYSNTAGRGPGPRP
jgi:uncharacterized membrane protein YraQ (UPF0718 family)